MLEQEGCTFMIGEHESLYYYNSLALAHNTRLDGSPMANNIRQTCPLTCKRVFVLVCRAVPCFVAPCCAVLCKRFPPARHGGSQRAASATAQSPTLLRRRRRCRHCHRHRCRRRRRPVLSIQEGWGRCQVQAMRRL